MKKRRKKGGRFVLKVIEITANDTNRVLSTMGATEVVKELLTK